MSDPIERQDVIDEAEKWIEAYNSGRGGQRERDAIKHVISGIKKLPSAQPKKRTEERTETHACDCIERQAAIEVIDAVFPVDPMKSEYAQGVACGAALAKTYVEQLPSAQPEVLACGEGELIAQPERTERWIPCSERLPEDGQDVLFCDIDEDIMLGYHVKGRPDTHFTQCGSWDEIKNVFAWMPLPEPYAERRADDC